MKRSVLLTLVLVVGCTPTPAPQPPAVAMTSLLEFPVPKFSFTERNGATITTADTAGKVWLASFVFTRCTGPCPQVAATMARLQDAFKDDADVLLVTFTIDPDRDTLTDLKKYADQYRADPKKWLFCTGPEKDIHAFAVDGFKLLAQKSATPKPGEEFDHSSRIAVVDRNNIIRGTFEGKPDPHNPAALENSIKSLQALVKQLQRP
jgi:protein SCO1